jgi:hypothetical protein
MSSEEKQGGLKALRIKLLELEDQLRIAITGEENE